MRSFVFLSLLLAGSVYGQLQWDNPQQTFDSKPGDKQVVAKYRFTNIGKDPITILDVRTSCGCTTTALKKFEYAPGESGEIEAKFEFGGRTGKQQKSIAVITSAAPQRPTFLQLVVNIEEPFQIQPEFVMWQVGEQAAPKVIRITIADDIPAKIVSVTSDNPGVQVQLTPVKSEKTYELQVTPKETTQPAGATLVIRTDYPAENPQTRYAYVRIK